jgi:integrase
VEIEIHAPLRRTNLVCLNLQQNIQFITVNGEKRWVIRFDRHETKNRALLAYELPAVSVKLIERAMKVYTTKCGWLFPGANGNHKTASCLSTQIKREVEMRLGCLFNVHTFRALVATIQMLESENGFERARALLGDRSERVIRAHYTAAAEKHLIRQAQDTIQSVRLRTAPIVRRHS